MRTLSSVEVFAEHRAMRDALRDEQHVARMHDPHAHLCFPLERALDAEDDLVRVDVAMPEAHIVLAPLRDVDLHAVRGVQAQRRAVRLVDIAGRELLREDIDHAENVAVLENAGIDHRRFAVRQHDILAVDGDALLIDLLRGLRRFLRLVHGFPPLFEILGAGCFKNGRNNTGVTGTTADVATQHINDLLFRRIRVAPQEIGE